MLMMLAILFGYLLGSVSTSYILGKLTKNIDIRQHGSGNPGATNTLRVLGVKAGIMVFAIDIIKGILAVLIGQLLAGEVGGILAGLSAVIGHIWPVFTGFRGGKGVATSFGVLIVIFPAISAILFVVFMTLVFTTRYISVGSIAVAIVLPILLIVFRYPLLSIGLGLVLAILVLYRHKENISRLIAGKENKIGKKSKLK